MERIAVRLFRLGHAGALVGLAHLEELGGAARLPQLALSRTGLLRENRN